MQSRSHNYSIIEWWIINRILSDELQRNLCLNHNNDRLLFRCLLETFQLNMYHEIKNLKNVLVSFHYESVFKTAHSHQWQRNQNIGVFCGNKVLWKKFVLVWLVRMSRAARTPWLWFISGPVKWTALMELLMTSGPVQKAFVHITGNCLVFPALFSVLAVSVLCVYVDFIHTALIQLKLKIYCACKAACYWYSSTLWLEVSFQWNYS